MADRTLIEWTDATWNPVTGCSKVSPGCAHCYAERLERRFRPDWKPWTAANAAHNVRLHPDRLDQPLRWRKPRRIFVCSMSDLFHDQVPDEFIAQVFAVMGAAPRHVFQVLTKRPARMAALLNAEWFQNEVFRRIVRLVNEGKAKRQDVMIAAGPYLRADWPLRNVWIGVSVENQALADARIQHLLDTPAAVRFLSCEPLLGPIDLSRWLYCYVCGNTGEHYNPLFDDVEDCPVCDGDLPKLDLVIVGGESGSGARPMHPDWVRQLRDQCRQAGVPFFFKQWGAWAPVEQVKEHVSLGSYQPGIVHGTRRGGTPTVYLDREGRIRSTNELSGFVVPDDWAQLARVGKARAGRLLDGRTWDEMPGTAVTAP